MKTVLRNNGDEITHKYICTIDGANVYLTIGAYHRFLNMTEDDIQRYYSGDAESEVESLKEDITLLLFGDCTTDKLQFYIARSLGIIKPEDILEINWNI
jgi:hypothetical protein